MASIDPPKRVYLPAAQAKHRAWRIWQALWKGTNLIVGGLAAGLSALIAANAANTENAFLDTKWAVGLASLAALLAFAQTAFRPSVQGAACEIAARELEKAIERYKADPTKDDVFLADAVERGIDLLGRVQSS